MFHADHTALQIIGHALVAFLFVYRGLAAPMEWEFNVAVIRKRGIPMPEAVFAVGAAWIFVGGVMVLIDWHADVAGWALVLFCVLANLIYHNFWDMEGMERRIHTWIFSNTVAVMGGCVLVAAGA